MVEDLVVSKEWREKGVGRRLLETVGKWAEAQGATLLQLLADRANSSALAFYEKAGWQKTQLICLRKR